MIKRVIAMTTLDVGAIHEAGDGKAALAIMTSTTIDLVLADLNMPVMDGIEMIAAMRGNGALLAIPVVVISAQPDPHQVEQLKRDGVAGYLPKPFTPEGMHTMIGPLLEAVQRSAAPAQGAPAPFNMTLAEALVEALETMAFISPELPEKPGLPATLPDLRVVQVAFHGEGVNGLLTLASSAQFGQAVAENCAAEDPLGGSDDALMELANVTCGLLLRKRLGGGVGFKMTPPILSRAVGAESWMQGTDVLVVNADGFPIAAHVTAVESLQAAGECT
jgi:two-component system chemotaxis response regulator CheY